MAKRSPRTEVEIILSSIKRHRVLEDRMEYSIEDLMLSYQISDAQARELAKMIQEAAL